MDAVSACSNPSAVAASTIDCVVAPSAAAAAAVLRAAAVGVSSVSELPLLGSGCQSLTLTVLPVDLSTQPRAGSIASSDCTCHWPSSGCGLEQTWTEPSRCVVAALLHCEALLHWKLGPGCLTGCVWSLVVSVVAAVCRTAESHSSVLWYMALTDHGRM